MRQSLKRIRDRVMIALRESATSHGQSALLDELAKIDEQIEREYARDEAFAELHLARTRDQLEQAVLRVRQSIHGINDSRAHIYRAPSTEEIKSMKSIEEAAGELA